MADLEQSLDASQLAQVEQELAREYKAGVWTGVLFGGALAAVVTYFIVREPKEDE